MSRRIAAVLCGVFLVIGCFAAGAQGAVTAPGNSDRSVVADWNMQAGGSGAIAVDKTGRGFDGAITGAVWKQQDGVSYLYFPGKDAALTLPAASLPNPAGEFTFEMWVYPEERHQALMRQGDVWAFSNWQDHFCFSQLKLKNGSIVYDYMDGVHWRLVQTQEWNHLVVTCKANRIDRYLNGVAGEVFKIADAIAFSGEPIVVGGSGRMAVGRIRFWNRALSGSEVKDLYREGRQYYQEPLAVADCFLDDFVVRADTPDMLPATVVNNRAVEQKGVVTYEILSPDGATSLLKGKTDAVTLPASGTARIRLAVPALSATIKDSYTYAYILKTGWGEEPAHVHNHRFIALRKMVGMPAWRELKWTLLQTIDCARDYGPNEYYEAGGKTTVVDSLIGKYRENSAGGQGDNRFGYRFWIKHPLRPHLIVYEYPDDKARTIIIKSLGQWDGDDGILTGGEFPISGKMQEKKVIVWPVGTEVALVVMNWQAAPDKLSAMSKISVYELEGDLPAAAAPVALPAGEEPRRMGYNFEDQSRWVTFGGKRILPEDDGQGDGNILRITQHLRFAGQDSFSWPIWWYGGAFYATRSQDQYDTIHSTDLSSYVPEVVTRMFSQTGLKFYPQYTFLSWYKLEHVANRDRDSMIKGADTICQVDWQGNIKTGTGAWDAWPGSGDRDPNEKEGPPYNPLHPFVQKQILAALQESVDRFGNEPGFGGIKIIFWPHCSLWFGSLKSGYDDYTVGLFAKETGVAVPGKPGDAARFQQRYEFLTGGLRDKWIAWRCRKTTDLFRKMSRILTDKRPDLRLLVTVWGNTTLLTAMDQGAAFRFHGSNRGNLPDFLDAVREGGLDVAAVGRLPGVVLEKVITPDVRRLAIGGAYTAEFQSNLLPSYNEVFRDSRESSVWIWGSYFENFDTKPPFKGFWYPNEIKNHAGVHYAGVYFMEPYTHALAGYDPAYIFIGDLGNAVSGQEDRVRRFAAAYRALPARRFTDILSTGTDTVTARYLAGPKYSWLYAVNREYYPAKVSISISGVGRSGLDLAENKPVVVGDRTLDLELGPYELKAFRFGGQDLKATECRIRIDESAVKDLEGTAAELAEVYPFFKPMSADEGKALAKLVVDLKQAQQEHKYTRLRYLVWSRDAELLLKSEAYRNKQRPKFPRLDYTAPAATTAPVVDGKLNEWSGRLNVVLDTKAYTPKNLSARAGFQWDRDYLYLAVEVKDDVMNMPKADAGALCYLNDSIQAVFDTGSNPAGSFVSPTVYPLSVCLTPAGAKMYWNREREVDGKRQGEALLETGMPVAAQRDEAAGVTSYELAFPWQKLGMTKPAAGTVIRFDVMVNDNDGAGRTYVELTPGIGGEKSTVDAAYLKLVN